MANPTTCSINSFVGDASISESSADGTLAIISTRDSAACLYTPANNTFFSAPAGAISYFGVSISGDANIAGVGYTMSDPAGNAIGLIGRPASLYPGSPTSYPANNYSNATLNHPRLNASGSLYYWAYPNYFEIIDVPTGTLRLRFSLAETVQNVETPIAIDEGGRQVFLITQTGLTVVDLGTAPLSIGHLTPNTGAGGTAIQVRGSGFLSGITATVGGQSANVTFVDETTLTMTMPTLPSGPKDFTVTNPNGSSYTLNSGIIIP